MSNGAEKIREYIKDVPGKYVNALTELLAEHDMLKTKLGKARQDAFREAADRAKQQRKAELTSTVPEIVAHHIGWNEACDQLKTELHRMAGEG